MAHPFYIKKENHMNTKIKEHILENFNNTDYHIQLFFSESDSNDFHNIQLKSLLEKLEELYLKNGFGINYLVLSENKNTKDHTFHILMNSALPVDAIKFIWRFGTAMFFAINDVEDVAIRMQNLINLNKAAFHCLGSIKGE